MPQHSVSVGETLNLGGQDKEKDFVLVPSTVQAICKMRFRGYGSSESGEDHSMTVSSYNTLSKQIVSDPQLVNKTRASSVGPTHGMKEISQRSISEIITQAFNP